MTSLVLVLDDDEDDCVMLTHLVKALFNERVSLTCTVNTENFLAHLVAGEQAPSLIILSYHLPPTTAIELIPHIKAQVGAQEVPLVVWSGQANEQQQLECLTVGASEYLSKDMGVGQLREQLYQLFTRYLPDLSQAA